MPNHDLELDYKVTVLPRSDGHVADYVAYYFTVCESTNCRENFEFALTVSESAKVSWEEEFDEGVFGELCINLLLRINPSTREYMVTTYDSFFDNSYERTLQKIRSIYSHLEKTSNEDSTQKTKEKELLEQVKEFNDTIDRIKDIVLPKYKQREYYDMLLVSKNQLLTIKPQSRSDIISFIIFVWVAIDAMSIENIIDLSLFDRVPKAIDFIKRNKFVILEEYYKNNQCKDMEEAISILKAIKNIRNKLVHLKKNNPRYSKDRKILGLEIKEPVDRLSVSNECIQILKKATSALRTIISHVEKN